MAQVEPMDLDSLDGDFDNKENTFQHNNVPSRTPCTEKGYEELDVSELNMKLRYSITPASSPMSKSLTGPYLDNRQHNLPDEYLNNSIGNENGNLTRSLHSTFTKGENIKSKALPLQTLSADPFVDSNMNSCMRRLLDSTDDSHVKISVSVNDVDDNMSLPSTSSSVAHTPDATTPTKEIPKPEGSPILRGLKNMLSMFRPSQSPNPPPDENIKKEELLSSTVSQCSQINKSDLQSVLESTPLSANRQKSTNSSRRSSPLKESVIFNDDLERELQWNDKTENVSKQEKIPVPKMIVQNADTKKTVVELNTTVEYMDISCNESISSVKNLLETEPKKNTIECLIYEGAGAVDSDNEFLDCETTFTKNESFVSDKNELEIGCDNQHLTEDSIESTTSKPSENENIPNTSVSTKAGEDSDTEKVKHDSSYIKEATQNVLKNECDNMLLLSQKEYESLNDEPQVINNMYNLDATMSLDDKIVNIDDKIVGPQMDNIFYNFNVNEQKELVFQDDVIGKIESSTSTINIIEHHEHLNTLKPHIEENLNAANSNAKLEVHDVNIDTDHSSFDNIMKSPNDNEVICILNSMEQTVSPDIEDMKALKESVDLFQIPHTTPEAHDSPTCTDNIMLNDVAVNLKTQDTIVDGFITHKSENLDIIESSAKDINVHFDNSTQLTLDAELNNTKDEEHKKSQANFQVFNNVENILENNIKDNVLKMSTSENINLQLDSTQTLDEPLNTILNTIANNREIPQLSVQNDLVALDLPSEIPLPDEGDIEQGVSDSNDDKLCRETCTTQDVTSEMCDKYSKINIADTTESTFEHFTITQNMQSNILTNIVDDHNIESVDNSKLNDKLPDTIESVHDINVEDIKSNIFQCANVGTINLVHSEEMDVPSIDLENKTQVEESKISDVQESHINLDICESEKERNITQVENKNIGLEVINTEESVKDDNKITVSEQLSPISEKEYINKDNVQTSVKDVAIYEKVTENIEEKVENKEIPVNPKEISGLDIHLVESNKSICMDNIEESKINMKNLPGTDLVNTVDDVEEIITSANNSPYVSVTDLNIDVNSNTNCTFEEIDNTVALNTEVERAASPCIVSKGYNFNFDEIDDPFATKTKIRMSPTPDSPNQSAAVLEREVKTLEITPKKTNNKQKILCDRKRSAHKKNFNSKVNCKENLSNKTVQKHNVTTPNTTLVETKSISLINENIISKAEDTGSVVIQSMDVDETLNNTKENNNYEKFEPVELSSLNMTIDKEEIHKSVEESQTEKEIYKKEEMKCLVVSTEKSTSSSEQYFSLGTSSGESGNMNRSRNVFNLPEIDDMNFNPFATKSRIGTSPQPFENILLNEGATNSSFVLDRNEEKNISTNNGDTGNHTFNKVSTKNSSNTSSATFSSNDKDATVREIHTEDEDTIEGPFLECNELKDIDKFTNLDTESGVMDLDEIPTQEKDVENGELFIDADALEFLLNQNKSTTVLDSGKESLFLKFDPLFAKRVSSDGVLAALHNVQKRQSTPKKISKDIPVAGPSSEKDKHAPVEDVHEDQSAMSKPMMVVNPAVSSIISPRKSISPPRINRRSLTFTSPAIAVIDRLLSLSGNSSHLNHDTSIPLVSREHPETDLAITHLRELLAEKEIHVHNLRSESKELKDRLAAIEVQVKTLETVSGERLAKINELNERLSEKTKINKSMATVVEEYERTIASLIAESEQDKKRNAEERMRLIKERDEQTAHLSSMEVSFSDLHSKYEKSKQIILNCKANEDIYKKSIEKFEENITKLQNNYELLKQHATSKLNHANQELEKMNRAHDQEVLKLNAMIKRKELHITTLQETVTQKTKANEELTAICDELINKVG